MGNAGRKLSLDRPVDYQIKVPGRIDESWSDWLGEMTIRIESEGDGSLYTTLTGRLDQAALQGLLRRLYSLGLPLVSVTRLECGLEPGDCSCRDETERNMK